jgi:hypothetical protein
MMDVVGRAKWNSWNGLKKMPKVEAEKKYIEYVNELLKKENKELVSNSKQMFQDIQVSILYGNVYKILLNRPGKLNSLSENVCCLNYLYIYIYILYTIFVIIIFSITIKLIIF